MEISATSAPDTSGVDSQYGMGCQAFSSITLIATRIFLSCRVVTEKCTPSLLAVYGTALE